MRKMNLLLGPFLVLILSVATRGAGAQAATEYGLAAGSSAKSVSSAGTALNRKLNQSVSGTVSHLSTTTVVHTTPSSGSKLTSTSAKNGQHTAGAHTVSKKASVDGAAAATQGTPLGGGFTVVGAENASRAPRAVTHASGASQSGITVVGAEPH